MDLMQHHLGNLVSRKSKQIFEPTIGMAFDCVHEAQEFCFFFVFCCVVTWEGVSELYPFLFAKV